MAYNYDELYRETPDALGQPTAIFVDFFDQLEQRNVRVLDIGCGQGRDAIFIARKGHSVVGVDLSAFGIGDLNRAAKQEDLAIEGVVADLADYTPAGQFDVVLIDRTLHMLAREPRLAVLARLLDHVTKDGWVLIADEASNMEGFKSVIACHAANWVAKVDKGGTLFIRRQG